MFVKENFGFAFYLFQIILIYGTYSMTPNFFLAYEHPKYAEFHADFKSVEIIGEKSQNFC
jgi:hypothetical protein